LLIFMLLIYHDNFYFFYSLLLFLTYRERNYLTENFFGRFLTPVLPLSHSSLFLLNFFGLKFYSFCFSYPISGLMQ
jgi:hypothetical protein